MYESQQKWRYYRHVEIINRALMEIFCGLNDRLMVLTAPRHGKSELVSKYTPPCYLGHFPDRRVLLTSYEADFAAQWGRKGRDILEEYGEELYGIRVSGTSHASNRWDIEGHTGGMQTAGALGPITGKGAHLAIIDDPVKNDKTAASKTFRDEQWDWYNATFYTRLEPGAAIILIQTRWHEDDLAGRLIKDMEKGGDKWKIIRLPAMAEDDDIMGRPKGAALCPARYNLESLERIKRQLGSYYWSALYQQRPMPEEGLLFRRSYFRYFEEKVIKDDEGKEAVYYVLHDPEGDRTFLKEKCWKFITVDPAATANEKSAYFAAGTWIMTPDRDLLLEDMFRERAETTKHLTVLNMLMQRWRPKFIGIESASYGLNIIQTAKKQGMPIRELKADRDKVSRARPMAARYEGGTVYHKMGAAYLETYETELLNFPNSEYKDQTDVAAYAGLQAYKEPKTIGTVIT